jgi:hypothetical protein
LFWCKYNFFFRRFYEIEQNQNANLFFILGLITWLYLNIWYRLFNKTTRRWFALISCFLRALLRLYLDLLLVYLILFDFTDFDIFFSICIGLNFPFAFFPQIVLCFIKLFSSLIFLFWSCLLIFTRKDFILALVERFCFFKIFFSFSVSCGFQCFFCSYPVVP